MMREWLQRCREEHTSCPSPEEQRLPTRVIDVGSENEDPCLIESKGRFGRWAALSHCWGRRLPIKTERESLKSHCRGIPETKLGPTFRDAVRLTRELGIQYLWIDALCIIQDCDSDWQSESLTMDYVYQNAAVTIAAEASPDSHVGLLGSMKDFRRPAPKLPSSQCLSKVNGVSGKLFFRTDTEVREGWTSRGPLSTRAWTTQEEILSPRILRFAKQQVLWRCGLNVWREWRPQGGPTSQRDFAHTLYSHVKDFPKPDPDYEILPSNAMKKALFSFWYLQVVNYYAGRKITYPRDRLVALSGIIKEIQKLLSETEHEMGIWHEDIHVGLAWATPVSKVTAYREYVAPSWSWAQLDFNTVEGTHHSLYNHNIVKSFAPLAEIKRFTSRKIILSRSADARAIEIHGECHTVCSCNVPEAFLDRRHSSLHDYYYHLDRIANPVNNFVETIGLGKITETKCSENHLRYLYLKLGRWEPERREPGTNEKPVRPVIVALILEETGTKLNPLYQRVGRALIPTNPLDKIEWPAETVTII